MSDRLRELMYVLASEDATSIAVLPLLAARAGHVMRHPWPFASGQQHNAAERRMRILQAADGGDMQRRVCGASTAVAE